MTSYPSRYRERLEATLASIDAAGVDQAIQWIQETRDAGRAIFVAGKRRERGDSRPFRLRHGQGREPE
jgi:hypothetical protein